ncbi:F-box/LRR-repeat protein [Striga hermonthica]|uniref:F-box/LRR-repeat protein n=1 Tax=Striga hermonthica TaxID=68872 RepID=A0A9N7N9F8_STRHE|nr:F-box/LRR-repeat protein [Striga hermonthica]
MEDTECISRRCNDMDIDILVRIFQNLNIFELTFGVGQVCQTWRMAACDPLLWKTLDMSLLKSNFIKIPLEPYVCPKLRRLIMPAWNRIKKTGICRAIEAWGELESLTMPSISNSPYLIEQISSSCKNFSELKIMGPCDVLFASSLATFLPDLKVLSLRCSNLSRDALLIILDGMMGLEVLNISHCMIVEVPPYPGARRVLTELDNGLIERASRLKGFITCMSGSCEMCRRTRNDEGLMRWYKYEEDLWRVDEVASLAF